MITQDKTPHTIPGTPEATAPAQAPEAAEAAAPKESGRFVWLAVVSLILTVAAWIAVSYNGFAAIAVAAAAILCGALALKSRRHAIRNTAITAIIAAAVLLVVIAAFFIVIYIGLKSV